MSRNDINDYVENRIKKFWFVAKNFKKEDMDFVDEFCKEHYDNNRKVMILDLIRYKNENTPLMLLNEKINFIYQELNTQIQKLTSKEDKIEPKKIWKGFSQEDTGVKK